MASSVNKQSCDRSVTTKYILGKFYVSRCSSFYVILIPLMSRITRKPTLWNLREVSIRISLSMPRRLTRTDTFRLLWIFCCRNNYSIHLSPLRRNVSACFRLRGLRRLICTVGFLVKFSIYDDKLWLF